jgi:hypothetical protein
LKFSDVVNLDICAGQKGKENFCAAVYDYSNQLSKLLHKSYDDINSGNKKDESAYKEESVSRITIKKYKRQKKNGAKDLKAGLEVSRKTKKRE